MSCVPEQSCSDGASAAGEGGRRKWMYVQTTALTQHSTVHTNVCTQMYAHICMSVRRNRNGIRRHLGLIWYMHHQLVSNPDPNLRVTTIAQPCRIGSGQIRQVSVFAWNAWNVMSSTAIHR